MSRAGVRTSFEQVQAILHADWDPIGCGVPLDEYDSYVWPVLKLLMAKAGRDEIATCLREAADVAMRSPVPEDRLARVVDKLVALDVSA